MQGGLQHNGTYLLNHLQSPMKLQVENERMDLEWTSLNGPDMRVSQILVWSPQNKDPYHVLVRISERLLFFKEPHIPP